MKPTLKVYLIPAIFIELDSLIHLFAKINLYLLIILRCLSFIKMFNFRDLTGIG